METLTSFEALDRKLDACRRAARRSDDALRSLFPHFQMAFAVDHPADPFGAEYRAFQMGLYERVAGGAYQTANEATVLDVAACVRRPFPYLTGSAATAGQHLGAVGFLLRSLRLAPGARILEFGPGWGNTTIALARLGFRVTAVDVEARFCAVIRGQAEVLGLEIDVVEGDFFFAESVREPFDAVIFFECFHHCADHLRLLRALHGAVVPGGPVYFGAEPILAEYPVPWGLRMDGEALWAIRENGWLELGFRESYFREALRRTGWIATVRRSVDLPWISVWEATRTPAGAQHFGADDPRLGTIVGSRRGGRIVVGEAPAGFGVYGPHVPLGPGRYRGTLHFAPGERAAGALQIDACAGAGTDVLGAAPVDPALVAGTGMARLEFTLTEFKEAVEVRLCCGAGASACVTGVTIEPVGHPQGNPAARP